MALPANAAVVPGTDLSSPVKGRNFSAPLSDFLPDFDGTNEIVLDWRAAEADVDFDMPDGDYVSEMSLSLVALPVGTVDKSSPLTVQFNSGKAVPVRSRGRRFDAVIQLNAKQIRSSGNTLRFSYAGGHDCNESDGKWIIDTRRSKVKIKAVVKRGGYQIGQLEPRLSHPMTAPRTVSITAKGAQSKTLEALVAQGIGLRTKDVPTFKLNGQAADFKILVGTRAALGNRIFDDALRSEETGFIGVQTRGGRAELVISAPDMAQTLALAKAFARYHLPRSRRGSVSLREMDVQLPFIYEVQEALNGRRKLHDMAPVYFDAGYKPAPVRMKFNVENGQASQGSVMLALKASDSVGRDSRLSVSLNGESLGYTQFDKPRKRVAFNIGAGQLQSGENELMLSPIITAQSELCLTASAKDAGLPHIQVQGSSAISIDGQGSAAADLGAMGSGTAALFKDLGAQTQIVLTSNSAVDRGAAYAILAKLAQSSGYGLIEADLSSNVQLSTNRKHALILGPINAKTSALLSGAPRSFREALRGNLAVDRSTAVASRNPNMTFKAVAGRSNRASAQGIAAMYRTSTSGGITGIFSASSPNRFASLSANVVKSEFWQNLSGSVAVWDAVNITSVQATDRTGLAPAASGTFASLNGIKGHATDFNIAASSRLESMSVSLKSWLSDLKPQTPAITRPVNPAPHIPEFTRPEPRKAPSQIAPQPVRRSAALPQLRNASMVAPANASSSPSPTGPKFSFAYLGDALESKADSVRHFLKRNTPKFPKKTAPQTAPQNQSSLQKFDTSSFDIANVKMPKLSAETFQSKGVLLGLVTLMALMMLGLARPVSANKNAD